MNCPNKFVSYKHLTTLVVLYVYDSLKRRPIADTCKSDSGIVLYLSDSFARSSSFTLSTLFTVGF